MSHLHFQKTLRVCPPDTLRVSKAPPLEGTPVAAQLETNLVALAHE